MKLKERLGKELLFFDGAMGSLLQKKGLTPGEIPEIWNITKADVITDIHESYLEAGCDIIKTNTFGANSYKLADSGYSPNELISAAVECAKKAVNKYSDIKKRYIALDIGPSGKLTEPLGDLSFEAAVELFKEQVISGVNAGVDLILIETMNDSLETKAAVLAAKENSDLPVFVTNVYDENKRLLTGASPLEQVLLLEGLKVDAIGANCSLGPEKMLDVLEDFKKYSSLPVILSPNAGLPKEENGETVYDISPEEFSDILTKAKGSVHVLGGCCGTNPEYIKRLIEKMSPLPFKSPERKEFAGISSYSKSVLFEDIPVIIGERINPTGKKKLKEAILSENYDYVIAEAVHQEEAGADLLDVNTGVPGIDESKVLPLVVKKLQAVTALPLQIDTASPEAMEKAMRIYNGKPLVNSVNGKKESMDKIFPLVKKYGGLVIALTLDDSGIPDTTEGRIKIADTIIKEAAKYGIKMSDLIFDPLAMAISADKNAAKVTLDTIKVLKSRGLKTSLGVSNVSFGLPERPSMNASFYTMAAATGLSCAIINPFSKEMMDAVTSVNALFGHDDNFENYINHFSETDKTSSTSHKITVDLKTAIIKGLKNEAKLSAEELIKTLAPMEIINSFIVPALDEVGVGFEKGTVYLPQLLISAASAQVAFDVVRGAMKNEKDTKDRKKIVIATVYGDIHDIGKNIVKALLENYGFDVIDLGKSVPKETILECVLKNDAKLLGLSALMTVTVPEMEAAIKLVHEKKPDCKIVVGGAVLTKDYAEKIGADKYAKDAMETVRYAEQILK